MWTWIRALLHILGMMLVRLSACLLVLRMPPVGQTKQRYARVIYVFMAVFVIISTVSFLLVCFHCTPIQGSWDRSVHARCIPMETWNDLQTAIGGMSFRFDI